MIKIRTYFIRTNRIFWVVLVSFGFMSFAVCSSLPSRYGMANDENQQAKWLNPDSLVCISLQQLVSSGQQAELEDFLGKGIDVELLNRLNRNGSALLRLAAQHGHVGVVNALITKGIDVNLQDSNGATALHLAACAGRLAHF